MSLVHVSSYTINYSSAVKAKHSQPIAETSNVAHTAEDAATIERIRSRFTILSTMAGAVKDGNISAMIVTGPPGVGKSHGVKEVLFNNNEHSTAKYEIVKGAVSPLGLYAKLYEFREEGNVLVFDDSDSILFDELSLNILKAALNSNKTRTISWNTSSQVLKKDKIPKSFDFAAGIIFITNVQFESVKSKKILDHIAALESRCHFIDLQMNSIHDCMLRIKQLSNDGLLNGYHLTNEQKTEVVDFVLDNVDNLRELSLRTVLKAADLRSNFSSNWKDIAMVTLMK